MNGPNQFGALDCSANFGPASGPNNQVHQLVVDQQQAALASLFGSLTANLGAKEGAPMGQQASQLFELQSSIQHFMSMAALSQPQGQPPANQAQAQAQAQAQHQFGQEQKLAQHQHQHQQHQQQQQGGEPSQQRINYCTICNKELCNKYFMKTHMLKMHGISLELEQVQPAGDQADQAPTTPDQATNDDDTAAAGQDSNQAKPRKPAGHCSVLNGFAGNSMGGVVCDICNKELCSKYFLKVHKQNTHGIASDGYQLDGQQLGGFMYPLPMVAAGQAPAAFLGSPVFQPQPQPQPHQVQVQLSQFSQNQQQRPPACRTSPAPKRHRPSKTTPAAQPPATPTPTATLSQLASGQCQRKPAESQDSAAAAAASHFESVYRLILGQQQQQQQRSQTGVAQPQPYAATAAAAAAAEHPAGHQLGALVCFNPAFGLGHYGGGPFGAAAAMPGHPAAAAAMSPAMIVDQILRNQHAFARSNSQSNNNNNNSAANCATTGANRPKDDTGADQAAPTAARGSKAGKTSDPKSSRYFNHYTEACPMCERRFKSIKWLKTHMMNDHKQEIAAYMQTMMQYLYAGSQFGSQQHQLQQHQQMVANSMAAFEQQQQQFGSATSFNCFTPTAQIMPQAFATNQAAGSRREQKPISLLSTCSNQQQQQFSNLMTTTTTATNRLDFAPAKCKRSAIQRQPDNWQNNNNHHHQHHHHHQTPEPAISLVKLEQQQQQQQVQDFPIDACCKRRQLSLSPIPRRLVAAAAAKATADDDNNDEDREEEDDDDDDDDDDEEDLRQQHRQQAAFSPLSKSSLSPSASSALIANLSKPLYLINPSDKRIADFDIDGDNDETDDDDDDERDIDLELTGLKRRRIELVGQDLTFGSAQQQNDLNNNNNCGDPSGRQTTGASDATKIEPDQKRAVRS